LKESKSEIAAEVTSIPVDWNGITGGNGLRYTELDWLGWLGSIATICICGLRSTPLGDGYGAIYRCSEESIILDLWSEHRHSSQERGYSQKDPKPRPR
jgi:hypothetical protein